MSWDWNLFNAAAAVSVPLVGLVWIRLAQLDRRAEAFAQRIEAQMQRNHEEFRALQREFNREARNFHARLAVIEAIRLGKSIEEIDEILERKFHGQNHGSRRSL